MKEVRQNRGQEVKQLTPHPNPLPQGAREYKKTCHPELVSGSHNYVTLKQAPTSILPHKGGSINPSLEERLGWVPIKSAVAKLNNKVAFTLAEVLITLGIIGVVAAMTLPAVVTKYRKIVIANQFKKNYAALSTAIQKGMAEYGTLGTWPCFAEMWGKSNMNEDKLAEIMKELIASPISSGSGRASWTINLPMCNEGATYRSLQGNNYGFGGADPAWNRYAYFLLKDGSCWYITHIGGGSYENFSANDGNNAALYALIDVNSGKKGPNKLGIDLHVLQINYNGKIAPSLTNQNPDNCKIGVRQGSGEYCTGRLVRDGFVFKDDYPWNY